MELSSSDGDFVISHFLNKEKENIVGQFNSGS